MGENMSTGINNNNSSNEKDEDFFKQQITMINEFADTVRSKQLERLFMLSETKEIMLDGRMYKRKPLTAKQHRRLIELDNAVSNSTDNLQHEDLLIDLRKAEGEFYFNMPPEVVDSHYEEIEDMLDACLLKTYTGIKGSEINIPELLEQFKKRYDNSLNTMLDNINNNEQQ
jgi:hypothetical protein